VVDASAGKSTAEILAEFDAAAARFDKNTVNHFGRNTPPGGAPVQER